MRKNKEQKIVSILLFVVIALNLIGCGTVYNATAISRDRRLESTPSGATFTIYNTNNRPVELPRARYYTIHTRDNWQLDWQEVRILNHNGTQTMLATRVPNSQNDYIIREVANFSVTSDNTRNRITHIPRGTFVNSDRGRVPIDIRYSTRIAPLLNTTPATVSWSNDYRRVVFELEGHQTQTARLRKNQWNPGMWGNLLFIGIGAVTTAYPDGLAGSNNLTDEEIEGYRSMGIAFLIGGGVSLLVDILTGNFFTYSRTISTTLQRTGYEIRD